MKAGWLDEGGKRTVLSLFRSGIPSEKPWSFNRSDTCRGKRYFAACRGSLVTKSRSDVILCQQSPCVHVFSIGLKKYREAGLGWPRGWRNGNSNTNFGFSPRFTSRGKCGSSRGPNIELIRDWGILRSCRIVWLMYYYIAFRQTLNN